MVILGSPRVLLIRTALLLLPRLCGDFRLPAEPAERRARVERPRQQLQRGVRVPQALPSAKMASAGADWQSNAATQIRWRAWLHQGPLRLAPRRLVARGSRRLVLTERSDLA